MQDNFENHAISLVGPAGTAFAITPADAADLSEVTRSLYVGGPGNISVVMLSGAQLTFQGLAAGTILPVRVRRVRATGTTATSIVGLA
jgi:hypothetical protein